MIHITHYAVRDLHALFPDDERYPAWDVVAKDNNGCVYYSEDVMDSAAEARAFIDGQCTNPYGLDWWRDKAVLPDHVRVPDKDWIEVPDEEPEPSGEAAGRAAYIENLVREKDSDMLGVCNISSEDWEATPAHVRLAMRILWENQA